MFSSLPKLISSFENIPVYLVFSESAIQFEADLESFLAKLDFFPLGYTQKEKKFSSSLCNLEHNLS